MGLCQSCGRCLGTTKETPTATFKSSKQRGCTDILFFLLFIAGFAGMLAIILVATGKNSEPERIFHGINWRGETCGQGNQTDREYNAWITMPSVASATENWANSNAPDCDDCFYIKTCLSSCDETGPNRTDAALEMIDVYQSSSYGYYCIPDVGALMDSTTGSISLSFSFSGEFDSAAQDASRAVGDLYTVWPVLLGSVAIALLFAFMYNFIQETFAGLLTFVALTVVTAGGVVGSYALIKEGRTANEDGTATNTSKAMYAIGIILAALTLIFVLIVIALRQRIRIAVEVVKESSRCVGDMWSLIIWPLVPLVLGLGYIVFWIVVVVYIIAVWNTEEVQMPAYITTNRHFPEASVLFNVTVNGTTTQPYESYSWDTSMQKSFAYAFFHLLWSVQFLIYFSYMVMAGAVANWYFAPKDANEKRIVGSNPGEMSHTPVSDSCCRTCRFHLGTVAVASLIIAIVEFIRAVIAYIEKKCTAAAGGDPSCLQRTVFCLIQCCLACVQCCLDKINKNALVWTAIWGDNFGTAACSSFKLLWGNLARTGAMSIVSSFLMFVGKVMIAVATCGAGGIIIHYAYSKVSSLVLPMIVMFIIGYAVGSFFMGVFEVAMDTIFLCFLIDEKLHAASGTMCASPGLRALVESEDMRKESQARAQQEQDTQNARVKGLGLPEDEHHADGNNNTGVIIAAAPAKSA